MKKIFLPSFVLLIPSLFSAVEILDRVAVIVDDGVIMESQINNDFEEITARYDQQNIPKPPKEELLEQVAERLIIEELQLQMADRAGVRISDSELNQTMIRVAANNKMGIKRL